MDTKLNIRCWWKKIHHLLKSLMRIHILTWLTILFVSMLFIEILQTQVIMRPIGVPKSISAKGYTAQVTRQHLIDKMSIISRKAKIPSTYWTDLGRSWSESDLTVPVTGFSIKSIAEYLMDWLPLEIIVISGEILLSENNDKFSLVLRINDKIPEKCRATKEYKNFDEMMMDSAHCVLEILIPHELASYYFDMNILRRTYAYDSDEYKKQREKITDLLFIAMNWSLSSDVGVKADAHIIYGDLYFYENRYEDAIRHYKESIKAKPDQSIAYSNWALTLERMGRFQQALEKHRKAIDVDPEAHSAYTFFGDALLRAQEYDCASAYYETAITLNPNYSHVYVSKGGLMLRIKEYEEAIENYRKAILIDPESAWAYTGWGVVLVKQKKPESAVAKFNKAIEIAPANLRPYMGLLSIYDHPEMDDEKYNDLKHNTYKKVIELQLTNPNRVEHLSPPRSSYKLEAFLDCFGSRVEPLPKPWNP